MGYFDFDGERLFDIRHIEDDNAQSPVPLESKRPLCLQSDSRFRNDLQELFNGNNEQAQDNKHLLEVDQRKDRQLRAAAEKRRAEGGKKIVYHYEQHSPQD